MNNKLTSKEYIVDPEVALPQVQNMIYEQCWKFSRTYPIPFDDCLSEAYLAFLKACMDYNPDKKGQGGRSMTFSSWAYYWVWCKLKDLVMKRSAEPLAFIEIEEDSLGTVEPEHLPLAELAATLSGDAKEIMSLFLDTPPELLYATTTINQLVTRVKNYFIKQRQWERARFEAGHAEIKMRFQEVWA